MEIQNIEIGDIVRLVDQHNKGCNVGLIIDVQKTELPGEWITFDYVVLTSSGSIIYAPSSSIIDIFNR